MQLQEERRIFYFILYSGMLLGLISFIGYAVLGQWFDAAFGVVALFTLFLVRYLMSIESLNYMRASRLVIAFCMLLLLYGYMVAPSMEEGLIYIIVVPMIVAVLRPAKEGYLWISMYYTLFFMINFFSWGNYQINFITYIQLITIHVVLFMIITFYKDRSQFAKERLKNLNRQLELKALTDPLTQLLNRRAYSDFMDKQILCFNRDLKPFSLALIDVDHFKSINDTYGHSIGDEVLVSLSKHLKENLRETDVVARFGGEEFVIYLHNTDLDRAYDVMEQLRTSLNNPCCMKYGITVSIGVSVIQPKDTEPELLQRADKAMYQAKAAGRNCTKKAL